MTKRRSTVLISMVVTVTVALLWAVREPSAQVIESDQLDSLYIVRYLCVPEVGPGGDAVVDGLGTLDVQLRTSLYFINIASLPQEYTVHYSGPDGLSGVGPSGTLAPGGARTITCKEIAEATGAQTIGEGLVFLKIIKGNVLASVVHTGYAPQTTGGGGLTFQVESRLQAERVGTLAFF